MIRDEGKRVLGVLNKADILDANLTLTPASGVLSFAAPGIGGPVLGIWLSIVKGILNRILGMVKGHQANAGAGGMT